MPLGLAASTSGVPAGSRVCAPPSWFRGVAGVRSAWPTSCGPFGRTPDRLKGTRAQRTGKRYERKALAYLGKTLGKAFEASPWFRFEDSTRSIRWCQPDGLLRTKEAAFIFEVKYSFSSAAWWQLRKLYEPVVSKAFGLPVQCIVVCKSFDSAVPFPEDYRLMPHTHSPCSLLEVPEWDRTRVFVWRP